MLTFMFDDLIANFSHINIIIVLTEMSSVFVK